MRTHDGVDSCGRGPWRFRQGQRGNWSSWSNWGWDNWGDYLELPTYMVPVGKVRHALTLWSTLYVCLSGGSLHSPPTHQPTHFPALPATFKKTDT